MGFYVQDDMWEAVSELPRKTQDEVMGALARLYFEGEQTDLKGTSKSLLIAFRDRVLLSKNRSDCGKQNGKQNRSKTEAKRKQTAKQNGSKTEANPESSIKEGERERDIEKESSNEDSKKTPPRHRHGRYSNVLLSDEDLAKLKAEFPGDWQERIERLSEYIASKGVSYKNHLATIRSWERRDRAERAGKGGDYDPVYSSL